MHPSKQITYKKYKAKIIFVDPGSVIIEIYDYGRYGTVQKMVDVKEIDSQSV